jgi:hypothetical protein
MAMVVLAAAARSITVFLRCAACYLCNRRRSHPDEGRAAGAGGLRLLVVLVIVVIVVVVVMVVGRATAAILRRATRCLRERGRGHPDE